MSYKSTIVALLLVVFYAHAGQQALIKDAVLSWTITGDTISFTYTVPLANVQDYDWFGVAIKDKADGENMANADFSIILKTSKQIQDRYASANTRPVKDSSDGGSSNISSTTIVETTTTYSATWTKKLNTGDSKDVVLADGGEYYLLYAFGSLNASNDLDKHADSDRGLVSIELSNDYEGNSVEDDDQGIYFVFATFLLGIYYLV